MGEFSTQGCTRSSSSLSSLGGWLVCAAIFGECYHRGSSLIRQSVTDRDHASASSASFQMHTNTHTRSQRKRGVRNYPVLHVKVFLLARCVSVESICSWFSFWACWYGCNAGREERKRKASILLRIGGFDGFWFRLDVAVSFLTT